MSEARSNQYDRRFRRAVGAVFACALVFVLAFAGNVARELSHEHQEAVTRAEREALTLAHSLSAHTEYTLRAAEVALDRLAAEVRADGGFTRPEALEESMRELSETLPAIDNLVLVNADGFIVISTAGLPSGPVDVSDRTNFQMHRDSPSLEVMSVEPIVGRVTEDPILPLSRRLSNPDGSFAGIAVATIGPGHFEKLFEEIEARPRSALLLAHENGLVMSRYPRTDAIGTSFAERPLFSTYLKEASAGTFISPPQSDGEVRIVGYRTVNGSDLVVAAALHRGEVLAAWREGLYLHAAVIAAFALIVFGAATLLYRQLRQQHELLLERDRQAQELQHSEARFRDLAELTADWFWETDMDQRFTFLTGSSVSSGAGIEAADWVGQDRWGKHREFTDASLPEEVQGYMDRGAPFHDIRRRFEHPEAGESWLSISGKALVDDTGRVVGYRGVGRNVTAEEKAAKAIRDQRELLRLVLENVPAGVYLKDFEGRYLLMNTRHKAFLGLEDKEIEGHTLVQLFDGNERLKEILGENWEEERDRQDREVATTRSSQIFDFSVSVDGAPRHIQVTKFPVFDADGNFVAIGGINIDVTEQRTLEDQLQQAQKLEAIGQLTGGIAHDFNNLLAVVLGNAELLSEGPDEDVDVQEIGRVIEAAADRGAELTNRLLAFSRQQGLNPQALDVNELIADFRHLLTRALGEAITVETRFADDLKMAYADPSQLENAILNLAINARDAMPRGGRLTIETKNVEIEEEERSEGGDVLPGAYVCIAVTDTGEGISPEIAGKVFEPFFTTKEVGKGSGLGLSMVYGFLKQSGGVARIYSEEGVGTTVRLYLPIAASEAAVTPVTEATGEDRVPQGNEVLLVVEDNEMVRDSVVSHLRGLGYEVIAAVNGDEGREILNRETKIDLLFTDLVMAGELDGYQLAEEALRRRPGIKVVLTTGFSGGSQVQVPEFLKDVPVVRKPYRRQDLATLLRRTLDERGG